MSRSYSLSTLQDLIGNASEAGYKIIQVSEGCLGLGHLLLIAPQPGFYSFEITERFSNEWSVVHDCRRFTKISNRIRSLIERGEAS